LSLIVQEWRFSDNETIKKVLDKAYEAKLKYPDLILGFDLVYDERVRPHSEFAELLYQHQQNRLHQL